MIVTEDTQGNTTTVTKTSYTDDEGKTVIHTVTEKKDASGNKTKEISNGTGVKSADGYGDILTEVRVADNVPEMTVKNLTEEMALNMLSATEKQYIETAVATGKSYEVRVYLTVTNIDSSVSSADKARVTSAVEADDYMYLDIGLFKTVSVDGNVRSSQRLTEADGEIEIIVEIPSSFGAVPSGGTRSYYIIIVHGGETTVIAPQENGDNTLTFWTDRFSTYAIAYKDTVPVKPNNNDSQDNPSSGSSGSDDSSDTSDNTVKKPAKETPAEEVKPQGSSKGSGSKTTDSDEEPDSSTEDTKPVNSDTSDDVSDDSGDDINVIEANVSKEPDKEMPKDVKDALEDAIDKLKEVAPGVIDLGYVIQDGTSTDGYDSENSIITISIQGMEDYPSGDYYLVTVDEEGRIILIPNESITDGTLAFTADPDKDYKLICDTQGTLKGMLDPNGYVIVGDKGPLKVEVRRFILFDFLVTLLLIAIGIIAFLKRKRWGKPYVLTVSVLSLILLILTERLGSIRFFGHYSLWFALMFIASPVIVLVTAYYKGNEQKNKNSEAGK